MKKLIAPAAGVLSGLAASTVLLGIGVAGANTPDMSGVVGKTYADASSAISEAGLTGKVATTVGDRTDRDGCVVSSASIAPFVGATDAKHVANTVLLNLNCYATAASAKSPGYSAASPEGKSASAAEEEAGAQAQSSG
jgi:hypothetical protein